MRIFLQSTKTQFRPRWRILLYCTEIGDSGEVWKKILVFDEPLTYKDVGQRLRQRVLFKDVTHIFQKFEITIPVSVTIMYPNI